MNILALSSSRVGNSGYLETAAPIIETFLEGHNLNIAFIPFAAVTRDFEEYGEMVKQGLPSLRHTIKVVKPETAVADIVLSDVIMIGGGNTFKLLHTIYYLMLQDIIRDKVANGAPYIGWSAGANITGPTIGTTNDMPIVEPKSFNALGFFPFQINPHYNNEKPVGHNGETRDERLTEFSIMNPGIPIVCLPEGTGLLRQGSELTYLGEQGVLFEGSEENKKPVKRSIAKGEDLSWLL